MPQARNLQGLPSPLKRTSQRPSNVQYEPTICPPVFLPSHHIFVSFGTCCACSHLSTLAVLCAWNIFSPDSIIVIHPSLSIPCSNATFSGKHSLPTFPEPHIPSPNIPLSPSLLYFDLGTFAFQNTLYLITLFMVGLSSHQTPWSSGILCFADCRIPST